MTLLTDIPLLCSDRIIDYLKYYDGFWRTRYDVAKDAVSLSMTCKTTLIWSMRLFKSIELNNNINHNKKYIELIDTINQKSKKIELVNVAKQCNLKCSGNKPDIFNRLIEFKDKILREENIFKCPLSYSIINKIKSDNWVELCVVSKELLLKPADRDNIRKKLVFNDLSKWGTWFFNFSDAKKIVYLNLLI